MSISVLGKKLGVIGSVLHTFGGKTALKSGAATIDTGRHAGRATEPTQSPELIP